MLKLAFLILIMIYTVFAYNISEISSGLLFEEMGIIQKQVSEWKVTTYINLTSYFSELDYVQSLVENVNIQCNILKGENKTEILCNRIVAELQDDIEELRRNNRYFIPAKPKRVRRGYLNIVGYAMKFLFGTMLESDAIYYTERINELEKTQIKSVTFSEKQATLLKSTFEKLNEVIPNLNEQNGMIQQLKDEVFILNKSFRQAEYFTRIHYLFEELAVYIKLAIDKVRRDQEKLFDITNAAYHGITHASIFDPHLLMDTIREISADLRGTMLPLPLMDHNLYKILALSDLVAVFVDDILIFESKLPLLATYMFKMYKVTAIPKWINNETISYITTEDELLIINDQRDKYFFLNLIQLKLNG